MRIEKEPLPLPGALEDPFYPTSYGGSLAETDFHTAAISILRSSLEDFYAAARRTYVHVVSDVLLSGEKAVPSARRDLDVFIEEGEKTSFRGWREGGRPVVVFEIASSSTHVADTGAKLLAYERLGLPEYFLFDPEGAFYSPTLTGYRLAHGRYATIRPVHGDTLPSEQLGLWLVGQGSELRVIDPETREMVPTRRERSDQVEEERDLARSEQREERLRPLRSDRAARQAGDRVRELEDELRRLRGSPPA